MSASASITRPRSSILCRCKVPALKRRHRVRLLRSIISAAVSILTTSFTILSPQLIGRPKNALNGHATATPLCLCEPYLVIASAAKQSTSPTTQCQTMDCHVAALLAETLVCPCERHPAIANPTPSLRISLRHCEPCLVIASAVKQST